MSHEIPTPGARSEFKINMVKKEKFTVKSSKKNDEKKVELENGEIEVFECEHCKFVKEKKKK